MEKIIAYQRSKTHDVLLTIMKEKQIWSKFGVDMDSRYVPSSEVDLDEVDQHVRAGKANLIFGHHFTPYASRVRKGGIRYSCVASISNRCPDAICAKAAIKSVNDLRGKRIAVQGTHPRLTLWRILSLQGLNVDNGEVELVRHPARGDIYQEMLERLLKGEVDAAYLVSPFDLKAREAGFVTLEETRFFPNIMGGTLTLTGDFTKSNTEAVERLIKAVIYGTWYVKTHPEESISIVAKYSRDEKLPQNGKYFRYTLERQIQLLESRPYPTALAIYHTFEEAIRAYPEIPNLKELNPLSVWDTHWLREIDDSGFIDDLYKDV